MPILKPGERIPSIKYDYRGCGDDIEMLRQENEYGYCYKMCMKICYYI